MAFKSDGSGPTKGNMCVWDSWDIVDSGFCFAAFFEFFEGFL
jgi:hypothetical protein